MIAHWSQLTDCNRPPLKNAKCHFLVVSGRHRAERSPDDSGTDKR